MGVVVLALVGAVVLHEVVLAWQMRQDATPDTGHDRRVERDEETE